MAAAPGRTATGAGSTIWRQSVPASSCATTRKRAANVEHVGACQREQVTTTVPSAGSAPPVTDTSIAWFQGLKLLTQ